MQALNIEKAPCERISFTRRFCDKQLIGLHPFRCAYANDLQAVFQHGAHSVSQLPAGVAYGGSFAFDAVVMVELVEAGGQIDQIPVDIGGVVVPGGQAQLFGILGDRGS